MHIAHQCVKLPKPCRFYSSRRNGFWLYFCVLTVCLPYITYRYLYTNTHTHTHLSRYIPLHVTFWCALFIVFHMRCELPSFNIETEARVKNRRKRIKQNQSTLSKWQNLPTFLNLVRFQTAIEILYTHKQMQRPNRKIVLTFNYSILCVLCVWIFKWSRHCLASHPRFS